jgi:transposase
MAYDTDVTEEQWPLIQPLFPVNSGRGRPMVLALQAVINGIFYLVGTGCQWRNLPNTTTRLQFHRC